MPENLSTICETLRSLRVQLKSLNKGEDEDHPLFQDISRALKQIESSADELHKRLKDNQDKLKKLPENIFQTLASLCGLDPDKGEEEQGPGSTSEERMSDTVSGRLPTKEDPERRMAHANQGRNASRTNDRQTQDEMNRERESFMQRGRQTNAEFGQQNRNEGKNGKGAAETDGKNTFNKNQAPTAKDGKGPHALKIDVSSIEHMSRSEKEKQDKATNMSLTYNVKSYESPAQNAGREEQEKGKHLAEDQAKRLKEKEEDIKKPKEDSSHKHPDCGTSSENLVCPEQKTDWEELEKLKTDREELEKLKHLAKDREAQLDEMEKDIKSLKQQVKVLITVKTELQQTKESLKEELEKKQQMINRLEFNVNEDVTVKQGLHEEIEQLRQDLHHKKTDMENIRYELDSKRKGWKMSFDQAKKEHEQEVRKLQQEIESLTKSRDDLRDRFSKVAGQKLNENNPDIADLSDPDRAMKLAERYSAIYDDEWTDAFQEQQEKMKRKTEDIVKYLLEVLKASYQFCEKTATIQMEALNNVFLHPCQDASLERNAMGAQGGLLDKPRIKSAEDKTLKDLRRKIASNMVSEVKEQFLVKFKKETADKKAMDLSLPYIGKCVEICWLMVLHDPQLHMGVDIKPDTRMDTNVYASYQNSGSVIEYLVWPPLFNGKNGGLLAKGTAQPRKEQGKGKGK